MRRPRYWDRHPRKHLAFARRDSAAFAHRIAYRQGYAFALDHADASFDLVVCRHMSQAVPNFPAFLAEITRVLAPGGWLHLLSEDYGMLHMPAHAHDPDRFWNENAIGYLQSVGCDGRVGRHTPPMLESAGYRDIAMDYVVVDTLLPRGRPWASSGLGAMGMQKRLAEASGVRLRVLLDFDAMIAVLETSPHYAGCICPL